MSDFTFTIKTTSKDQSFTLPLKEVENNIHNFTVDWGDTNSSLIESYDDINKTHIYSAAESYLVSIRGNCPWFSFGHIGDRLLITSVNSWGDVGFVNLNGGFNGCTNLKNIAGDGVGLKEVTNFDGAFSYCRFTSIPTGLFDSCTKATDFNAVFYQCDCLTSIPTDLFKYCTEAKSFIGAFCGCTNLMTISEKLFNNTTKATSFAVCFSHCEKVNTVSATLFKNYASTIDLKNTFYKTKITVIPIPGAISEIEP